MSEAKKQEKDFTLEVEALVKEATDLATVSASFTDSILTTLTPMQNGKLPTAIEKLLALEKQARNVSGAYSLWLNIY